MEILQGYIDNLKDISKEFSNFKPMTDWDELNIKPLLRNCELLKKMIVAGIQSLSTDLIEAELDYFKKNIDGLGMVLEAEKKLNEVRK